jgi:hypothetical protein
MKQSISRNNSTVVKMPRVGSDFSDGWVQCIQAASFTLMIRPPGDAPPTRSNTAAAFSQQGP